MSDCQRSQSSFFYRTGATLCSSFYYFLLNIPYCNIGLYLIVQVTHIWKASWERRRFLNDGVINLMKMDRKLRRKWSDKCLGCNHGAVVGVTPVA
jgi:hypothetical protein